MCHLTAANMLSAFGAADSPAREGRRVLFASGRLNQRGGGGGGDALEIVHFHLPMQHTI